MKFSQIKICAKYVLSIALLMFLFAQMDLHLLIKQAVDLDMWVFVPAMVFIILQIVLLNVRWHLYINVGARNIPFRVSSLINVASQLANIIFITSVGGVIAKSGLAVREGLSWTQSIFATFLDRFMTLFALIILSAIGLPFLTKTIDGRLVMMLALTIAGVILSVVLFLFILRSGKLKNYIFSRRRRAHLVAILRTYTEDYALMIKTGIISIFAQICFIICVYIFALGFDNTVQNGYVIEFLALIPVIALISSLPISFGGWGVREGAFVYGLALIGFPMESAFLLSVQVGLVTLVAPFIVGVPYLLKLKAPMIFKLNSKRSV